MNIFTTKLNIFIDVTYYTSLKIIYNYRDGKVNNFSSGIGGTPKSSLRKLGVPGTHFEKRCSRASFSTLLLLSQWPSQFLLLFFISSIIIRRLVNNYLKIHSNNIDLEITSEYDNISESR